MEALIITGGFYNVGLIVFHLMFWLARSIQQIVFYKLRHRISWAFLLLFFSAFLLYALPAFYIMQYNDENVFVDTFHAWHAMQDHDH